MKKIVKLAIVLLAMATAQTANAQDNIEAEVSADVVSSYVWRGQEVGEAAIQPTLGVSYKGLSLSAWGSAPLKGGDELKELDLTLAYSTGGFNVGVTDYFCVKGSPKYFLYDSHETAHVFEANIGYDFGPVNLQWYTNFAGADGVNKDGKRAYSSYIEAKAPFALGGLDWEATVGAVPFATTFYEKANSFAVTDISLQATKDIKITDSFSVPVFAGIHTNPSTQRAAFVVGFTLKP